MTDLDRIAALLKTESTLALATCSADGEPHIAPLFYIAGRNLELYWFSSPASRHGRDLEACPAAAVSIYRSTDEWKDIRGVQMRGEVSMGVDAAIVPAYRDRFRLGPEFSAVIDRSRLYCFRPAWARYIDNSRGFGYQFETRLPV